MKTLFRLGLLLALLTGLVFGAQAQTAPNKKEKPTNEGELIARRRAEHPDSEAAQYLRRQRRQQIGLPEPGGPTPEKKKRRFGFDREHATTSAP